MQEKEQYKLTERITAAFEMTRHLLATMRRRNYTIKKSVTVQPLSLIGTKNEYEL